ncbi:MAG: hypothetical protein QGD92_08625 [Gammaproteobacteria bacterium]|nr:hypothetical protein [Gammaproteobacteria bacterium]
MTILIAVWFLAISAADVSNERIPVSGTELEQHWQIDCSRLIDDYNNRIVPEIVPEKREITIDELRDLAAVAEKCRFIYNQKGTGRTVACPDYQRISDILQDFVLRDNGTKPADLTVEKCEY